MPSGRSDARRTTFSPPPPKSSPTVPKKMPNDTSQRGRHRKADAGRRGGVGLTGGKGVGREDYSLECTVYVTD